jgi:hypothetical protein
MNLEKQTDQPNIQNDAILRPTRLVAAVIVPFLIAAFVILFFMSAESGEKFAWQIDPPMTAAIMGAGYLGGVYFFIRVLIERHWHKVQAGYLPVAVYTFAMLIATFLHWDRFDTSHWPFQIWLVLYILTPALITLIWWYNRRTDPGYPEHPSDQVPKIIRRPLFFIGLLQLVFALFLVLSPQTGIAIWPWTVTPLTTRVLAGWLMFLAVGAMVLGQEPRWSSWRIPLQSILIWQTLVLMAGFIHRANFENNDLLNWFMIYTVAGIIGVLTLYWFQVRSTGSE